MSTSASATIASGARVSGPDLGRKLLHVAWMSIGLGILLEIVLLGLAIAMDTFKGGNSFIAGLVQKVTWSTIVCAGLAIGTAASKARVPAMGIMGLLSAPLAFTAAKSAHKSLVQTLSLAAASEGPSPFLLGALKAVQYASLGIVIAVISKRLPLRLSHYLATGLAAGVVFGGMIIGTMIGASAKPMPASELVARSVNELIFPVGCSLVLYAAEAFGKRSLPMGQRASR